MLKYPSTYRKLLPHWAVRFAFFLLGIVLFYAPFALGTKLLLQLMDNPRLGDAHTICLRMPIQWLTRPWMYGTLFSNPNYLVVLVFLPLIALFFAPLFCGWMCPAGQITEFLSRLIPPRFQLDLSGKVSGAPVRYGFTLGMMAVGFIGGNACCTFCNFSQAQNIIGAVFGNFRDISYLASFSMVTFGLWFIVMGLFTKGGRGWCNFLCPAGALMGLAHWIGAKLKISWLVKIDQATCNSCAKCVTNCPAWAVTHDKEKSVEINRHACTACMDCAHICPVNAIRYGRAKRGQA